VALQNNEELNFQPFLKTLTTYTGYPEEHLVAGAGMDEIITTICRIFLGKVDVALIPVPTYNFLWRGSGAMRGQCPLPNAAFRLCCGYKNPGRDQDGLPMLVQQSHGKRPLGRKRSGRSGRHRRDDF